MKRFITLIVLLLVFCFSAFSADGDIARSVILIASGMDFHGSNSYSYVDPIFVVQGDFLGFGIGNRLLFGTALGDIWYNPYVRMDFGVLCIGAGGSLVLREAVNRSDTVQMPSNIFASINLLLFDKSGPSGTLGFTTGIDFFLSPFTTAEGQSFPSTVTETNIFTDAAGAISQGIKINAGIIYIL